MDTRCKNKQSGFTLVELLVAITILAMVLVAVTGSVRASTRLAGSVTERAHSVDRQVQIRSFLRRHLTQASTMKLLVDAGREVVAFSGSSSRISFVAPMPESAATSGLHQLALQVEDSEHGQQLVLLHVPFLPQLQGSNWNNEVGREVLLEDMQRIEFSYRGGDPATSYWSDEWNNPEVIPALIRIEFGSQDHQAWPHIIVSPRIDSPDPLSENQ
jgi:general secretion pathway protein J